jgi:hypothetical protein
MQMPEAARKRRSGLRAPDDETLARFGWKEKHKGQWLDVRIEKRILRSPAFIDLTHTSQFVLLLFLARRPFERIGIRQNQKRIFGTRNLVFTYTEAKELWGISRRTFCDSINQLIAHGFLKIEQQGGTLQGARVPSVYALVDDWKYYDPNKVIQQNKKPKLCYSNSLKKYNKSRKQSISSEDRFTRQVRAGSLETGIGEV